jgi:hypothetical protein
MIIFLDWERISIYSGCSQICCLRMLLHTFIFRIVLPWSYRISANSARSVLAPCFWRNCGLSGVGLYFHTGVVVGVCKGSLFFNYWRSAQGAQRILVNSCVGIVFKPYLRKPICPSFKWITWLLIPRFSFFRYICTWSRYILTVFENHTLDSWLKRHLSENNY